MKKNTTMKRLGKYIKKRSLSVVLILIFSFVSILASLYVPVMCGRIIDILSTSDPINGSINYLIIIALCTFVTNVFSFAASLVNNKLSYSIIKEIRNDCFDTIQKLPLAYIDSHRTGENVSKVISDVDTFADGLIMGFTQLFSAVLTIIITLVYMITINPKITALVVVLTPLSILFAL